MSKKRKREVDVELVQVYEGLADEDESVRLKAALTLVTTIFIPGVTTEEQTESILIRLFRGLCSGRKAARLGFSVALTELLAEVSISSDSTPTTTVPTSHVIDILERQTVPEGGTSGQDERDHYFGRVFGAEAVLKSAILFKTPDPAQWRRLLDIICTVAIRKPWLRQACGRALFTCIAFNEPKLVPEAFAIDTIHALSTNKLIRSPEGVAIWIAATRTFPDAQFPKSIWKYDDPLASKDISSLTAILKDARTQSDGSDESFEAQGSAGWSANLHFAWDVVLSELYREVPNREHNQHQSAGRASFDLFWQVVVDNGLFADSSSTERKAWGFNLWRKTFETAPQPVLQYTFSQQALRCLINSLKAPERYLQKSANRVTQIFSSRLSGSEMASADQTLVGVCIKSLLEGVSFGDFDQITKTKTMHNILEMEQHLVQEAIFLALEALLSDSFIVDDEKTRAIQQKCIITLQGKLLAASLRHSEQQVATKEVNPSHSALCLSILKSWVRRVYVKAHETPTHGMPQGTLTTQARGLLKDRLASGFEQTLKTGATGIGLLREVMLSLLQLEKEGAPMDIEFEDAISKDVQKAWKKLAKLKISNNQPVNGTILKHNNVSFHNGLALLYCLVLFQVYNGEAEAVEILQEVLALDDQWKQNAKPKSGPVSDDIPIVQILLGFASRPSKFMRRVTVQIFESFAPQLSRHGLESLCEVLDAKENAQGQEEMFEARDVEMNEDDADNIDSDMEGLPSDVEIVDASDDTDGESGTDSESGDSESNSEEEQDEDEDGEDDKDEDLAAFDAALASALGTRSLSQNDGDATSDSDSDSDADMDDDEMMELDSKLVEVFRAREEEQNKKKQRSGKEAKENIINFKNRVLDLVDLYLKQQHQNALAIDLILPLLRLIRTTQAKQVAIRAGDILRGLSSRCKGQIIPNLEDASGLEHAAAVLTQIHEEASQQSSNAHSTLASLGSILLVKAITKKDPESIRVVVDIYADTRLRQLTDKSCYIAPGFFSDWNNWCQSIEKRLIQ